MLHKTFNSVFGSVRFILASKFSTKIFTIYTFFQCKKIARVEIRITPNQLDKINSVISNQLYRNIISRLLINDS